MNALIEEYHIHTFFSDFGKIRSCIRLIEFPRHTYIYSKEEHRKYVFFHISVQIILYSNDVKGNSMFIRRSNQFSIIGDMELMGYTDSSNLTQTAHLSESILRPQGKYCRRIMCFCSIYAKVWPKKWAFYVKPRA